MGMLVWMIRAAMLVLEWVLQGSFGEDVDWRV